MAMVFTNLKTVSSVPFLIKKVTCTAAADADTAAVTHGQLVSPDVAFVQPTAQTTPGSFATSAASATTQTVELQSGAAATGTLYMIWFGDPASGGLNPPS